MVLLLLRQCSGTFDRSLLGNDLIEVLVLTVDALQPAVAFAVRVDAVSQPSADLLEGRGFPVRLVPREAFKFGVIRVEGNDLLLADLTSVLDHLLNEQGHFFQERLVTVDDLEELALLQDVVVELLQTVPFEVPPIPTREHGSSFTGTVKCSE